MMDKNFEGSARAADHAESKKVPKWADDFKLKRCGRYYEGFVNDYDLVLSQHCVESVATYGVRKSKKTQQGNDAKVINCSIRYTPTL